MKVYKSGDDSVMRIDFCCPDMARDVLLGDTTMDSIVGPLTFTYGPSRLPISYCNYCGAKVDGDYKLLEVKYDHIIYLMHHIRYWI